MTQQEIIQDEFNLLKQELIKKHIELGMPSSGKWVNNLEIQTTPISGVISGENYTKQLTDGRPSGKFPPIDAIKKWIVDKGIQSEIPINSLAFLIARKIAREGTNYFKQGGTDLVSGVFTPARIDKIRNRLGVNALLILIGDIETTFKELA